MAQCLLKAEEPDVKAQILRIRARNHFMRGSYTSALNDTISGLHLLGVNFIYGDGKAPYLEGRESATLENQEAI